MEQAKLNELKLKHVKWYLGEDGGEKLSLPNANLYGADLRGADLRGADLYGANDNTVKISGLVMTGFAKNYEWVIAETQKGVWLKFGCEERLVADWKKSMKAVCETHAPMEAKEYAVAITALIKFFIACIPKVSKPSKE